jgi:LDH2 family malate/lactate/ureidoglycolate dehydrogenase
VSEGSAASVRVAAGDLAHFVARAFERLGAPEADAWSVAERRRLRRRACGRDVVDFTKDATSPTNTGQFVAAIRVSAFRSRSVRQHGGRGVRPDASVRAAARPPWSGTR